MANHKSALKRIRSNEKRRVLNRYQHKTTRNAIKALRIATDKADAAAKLSTVISMIDKLAKKNIIHDNNCLLYTSDAADERSSVDLGGRRIIKKNGKS